MIGRRMERNTPSKEILDRLAEAGVPKNVIAMKLVVSPSAVSDLYAGKRQLKHDEAVKLLNLAPKGDRGRELPVIGMAGAGNWVEAIEHTRERVWVPYQAGETGKFAVEVVGQSMNLLLPEGSLAIVDPDDRDLFIGKLYLLLNSEGEATIKRYRVDPARFEPVSDDSSFAAFRIGSFDFQVVGRVTFAMQRF